MDLEYRVDSAGVITFVSDRWDRFARLNGGTDHVLAADVIGQPLLAFVAGSALKHLWETVIARVVAAGQPLVVPFRCDAPGQVRSMEMRIEPSPDGGLRFLTRVVRAAERSPAKVTAVTTSDQPDGMLWMCSWCKRLLLDSRWMEVDDAARLFGLFESDDLPSITHGLCASCEHAVAAELERLEGTPGALSATRVDRGGFDLV